MRANFIYNRWFKITIIFLFGLLIGMALLSFFKSLDNQSANLVFAEEHSAARTDTPEASSTAVTGQNARSITLAEFNELFSQVSERVTPSVVTIHTERVVERPEIPQFPFDDFFGDDFFGRDFWERFYPRGDLRQQVLGSGVIVREDGYILTNNHVVEQGEEITVTLADGREFNAVDIKTDPPTDLAVIKIDAGELPAISFGDSEQLRVGEWVLAIGNPFAEELRHTVTAGIISAKGRTNVIPGSNRYENFLQTDAAINPGNSGGALVNLQGELVGINTAIATSSGGFQGIGFAIPINMASRVMDDLLERGRVIRAYLGVRIQELDNEMGKALGLQSPNGAMVMSVEPDTPAEEAGLQEGDVIIGFDGETVRDVNDLRNKVAGSTPGSVHMLTLVRDKRERSLKVRLQELTEDLAEAGTQNVRRENFGMTLRDLTPALSEQYDVNLDAGVLVVDVQPGSQAAEKNIRPGSVITHVGTDNRIRNLREYRKAMSDYEPGDAVLLRISYQGQSRFVGLIIEADE